MIAEGRNHLDALTVKKALSKITPLNYSLVLEESGVPEFNQLDLSQGKLVSYYGQYYDPLSNLTPDDEPYFFKKTYQKKTAGFSPLPSGAGSTRPWSRVTARSTTIGSGVLPGKPNRRDSPAAKTASQCLMIPDPSPPKEPTNKACVSVRGRPPKTKNIRSPVIS